MILILPIFYFLDINMDKAVIEKSCLKQNWVMNIKDQEFDFVFLGSSRTENMIDATMISNKTGKSVINIGVSGCGHEELFLLLNKFLENGNKIKNLFYQNDIYGFQIKAGVSYHFHDFAFLPYLGDSTVDAVFSEVSNPLKFYTWKYIPFIKYAEFNIKYPISYLWSENMCDNKLYDDFGSALLYEDNQDVLNVKRLFVDTTKSKYYEFNPQSLKYVKKNMRLAVDHNINLCVYTAPEYYALYKTQMNRQEMNISIDSLCRSYDAEFLLFEDEEICKDKSLFTDYSHLNAKGTKIFTEMLIQYMDSL
jgi:hypothetical protein